MMDTRTLTLYPGMRTSVDGWTTTRWHLASPGLETFMLEHAVPDAATPMLAEANRGDHALLAALMWAMQRQLNIEIDGVVSPRLLDGLCTFMEFWHRCRPRRYAMIDIRAAEEREAETSATDRGSLFAFSGGVDASFSLFRHLQGQAGRTNRKVGAALLVHGMDIPLKRADFFGGALQRAQRMLESTNVPLLPIRTNSRGLGQLWEDSYGLQLFACFLLLQRGFAFGIHGSGEPYDSLILPWGTTPLTDHLCSTALMQIEHDGCLYDRTEKVAWIGTHTDVGSLLRVCWAGETLDRNCGKCEKCVRTMLNFWASSLPVPDAFPTKLSPALVRAITPKNDVQLNELRTLLCHAERNHAPTDEILGALKAVLRHAQHESRKQRIKHALSRLLVRKHA